MGMCQTCYLSDYHKVSYFYIPFLTFYDCVLQRKSLEMEKQNIEVQDNVNSKDENVEQPEQ